MITLEKYKRISLRTFKHKRLYYDQSIITNYLDRIEKLTEKTPTMKKIDFATRIMDTVPRIELTENTFKAHRYILQRKEINKESIRTLYAIVSADELRKEERKGLGDYYRTTTEFMLNKKNFDLIKIGAKPEEVEKYMDTLIDFINDEDDIDDFIKSMIIHNYMVYIHPYPNINGRTSRLISTWHLIRNQKYPYILFNRIPSFYPIKYSNSIKSIYHHGNITPFLTFMLKETEKEIKKMNIIENIISISDLDIETIRLLEYLLLVKEPTIENLSKTNSIYNSFVIESVIEEKLETLVKSKILLKDSDKYHINQNYLK